MEIIIAEPKDKKFLFELGRLFAKGEQIWVINSFDLDETIKAERKAKIYESYSQMIVYWQDNKVSPIISSNEIDYNQAYLIYPKMDEYIEDKQNLRIKLSKMHERGIDVYYPNMETSQDGIEKPDNTFGYNFCLKNAKAMAKCGKIFIYYNPKSLGSIFELGIASYLCEQNPDRKFILLNEVELNPDNFIDAQVKKLSRRAQTMEME